jgi:hypothetical protein
LLRYAVISEFVFTVSDNKHAKVLDCLNFHTLCAKGTPLERAFVMLFCKLLVNNTTALLFMLLESILIAETEG